MSLEERAELRELKNRKYVNHELLPEQDFKRFLHLSAKERAVGRIMRGHLNFYRPNTTLGGFNTV